MSIPIWAAAKFDIGVPPSPVYGSWVVNQRRVATAAGGATPATGALTQARAAEMATSTQQLLAPYVRRIEEQAEEIGRVRAELAHARAALAEATSINGQAKAYESAAPE